MGTRIPSTAFEVERILSDNTGLDIKDVVVLDEGVPEDLYAEPD